MVEAALALTLMTDNSAAESKVIVDECQNNLNKITEKDPENLMVSSIKHNSIEVIESEVPQIEQQEMDLNEIKGVLPEEFTAMESQNETHQEAEVLESNQSDFQQDQLHDLQLPGPSQIRKRQHSDSENHPFDSDDSVADPDFNNLAYNIYAIFKIMDGLIDIPGEMLEAENVREVEEINNIHGRNYQQRINPLNKYDDKDFRNLHLENNEFSCSLMWGLDQFEFLVNSCIPSRTLTGNGIVMPTLNNKAVAALSYSPLVTLENTNTASKKNYCMFCDKKVTSISRHFLSVHSTQPEIARIEKMTKNSKERREALRKLRARSNNFFNSNVTAEERIVTRRSFKTLQQDYLSCPSCFGLFASKNIAKHHRVCSGRIANMYPVTKVARLSAKYIPDDMPLENYLLDTLLSELRDGDSSTTIKDDYALRLFAKKLAVAHKSSKHLDFLRKSVK
ncbi:hypothetical protein RN001_003685 [Aquatica leii]|uniref:Uncharacterized protein n=1 Tax=Aquatica leii TaxID=1421715 RepID=A0AAN7SMG0_9COLE|nr:hypothetical protein RN001_003685 [Aquatica leii]